MRTMNSTSASTRTDLVGFNFIQEIDWVIPIAINTLLIAATFWILISLIHYGVRTGKWRQTETSQSEKLNTGMVYSSLILCAIMCICRYVVAYVHMSVGFVEGEDELCDSLSDATSCFYMFILLTTALFLWLRQRIFYTNSMLNVNYTRCVKFFSCSSILVIVLFGIAVLIFSTIHDDHPWSPEGCTYKPDDSLRIYYWIAIVVAVGFGQVSLMSLFVHALRKTRVPASNISFVKKQRKNSEFSKSVDTEVEQLNMSVAPGGKDYKKTTKPQVNHNHSVVKKSKKLPNSKPSVDVVTVILRKTFFFAIASLLADILIQVFSLFISTPGSHRRTVTTLFSVNAFLNLLFLIFSFVQYKQLLFSPCYKR